MSRCPQLLLALHRMLQIQFLLKEQNTCLEVFNLNFTVLVHYMLRGKMSAQMQELKMMLGLRPLSKKFTMRSLRKKRQLPVMKKYWPHVKTH